MKERVAMTKKMRSAHRARRARIATTGLSLSAMLGMISVFGWNAQVAAQAETAHKIEVAKQAKIAAQIVASRAAAKPHVRVVVVTVPAPVRTRYVTVPGNNSGSQATSNSGSGYQSPRVVTSGSNGPTTTRVNRPAPVVHTAPVVRTAPVVHTAPVVVTPPVQNSQATSGGSRKP
jgi:hypothetical protein